MTMYKQTIWKIGLSTTIGNIFQPTGFPDVGPALFDRPKVNENEQTIEMVPSLLVESAQSMANNLEASAWNSAKMQPVDEFDGIPWVKVIAKDDGRFLTSSRLEAHRLASAFIKDSTLDGKDMKVVIKDRFNLKADTPLNYLKIAEEIFKLDPMTLIHGVFFAESSTIWPGQPKIRRALTAMIEAEYVEPVNYGGVKFDLVRHKREDDGGSKEGYGSIPFHRQEFSAASIHLHIALDTKQLESYGLGDDATALLECLAKWEIRSFIDGGIRLRTNCDFELLGDIDIESLDELNAKIRAGVSKCREYFGSGEPIEVLWGK